MKARKPTSRLVCASHATSFNGAAPLKARKHAALRWVLGLLARLQWGRAVEGAETAGGPLLGRRDERASMGPRR